jgi:RNA-splicing ligase RtcB
MDNKTIIEGKYNNAIIFADKDNVEEYAIAQVKAICDMEVSKDSIIRVMPDVHPGKVGPIGFTMTFKDFIIPSLVGVDLGCGITMLKIGKIRKEFQKIDSVIREQIPVGFSIREKPDDLDYAYIKDLHCIDYIDISKALRSLGTLGGGNHFIEIDQDDVGDCYITVHSGSRHFGLEIAEYYMLEGHRQLLEQGIDIPYELSYLTGDLLNDYIDDVRVAQFYAQVNRLRIINTLCKALKWKSEELPISCEHNYIDTSLNTRLLRKGAIRAKNGNVVIIPINMRDGVIIGTGKGNADWNYSAPHGAGRLYSRTEVKNNFTVSQFKKEMTGIYSSCIGQNTLDESPFAYRDIDYIKEAIKDTVEITDILKPIYNFKAGGKK